MRTLTPTSLADTFQIEATAEKWGVAIESILLKDINFSVELQQSLSSAATQKRIGESKVIAARAEVDAAKLMRQAADVSRHSLSPQSKVISADLISRSWPLQLLCRSDSLRLCKTWHGVMQEARSSLVCALRSLCMRVTEFWAVPMNLGTMGAAGMDANTQQIAASSTQSPGQGQIQNHHGQEQTYGESSQQPNMALNAGMISAMSNL